MNTDDDDDDDDGDDRAMLILFMAKFDRIKCGVTGHFYWVLHHLQSHDDDDHGDFDILFKEW